MYTVLLCYESIHDYPQGYVTEIMLTLNASVDNLDVEMKPLMKEIFLSTPNLNKESRVEMRRSITGVPLRQQGPGLPYSHIRSTSYNLSVYARRAVISAPIMENKGLCMTINQYSNLLYGYFWVVYLLHKTAVKQWQNIRML